MATQRITIVKTAGSAATAIRRLFEFELNVEHETEPSRVLDRVDVFAEQIRTHAHLLPMLYFAEWVDTWSMGDLVPGLRNEQAPVAEGRRFQLSCHGLPITIKATTIGRSLPDESKWLKWHIREAEKAWSHLTENLDVVIVVMREVLGGTVSDEEISESLTTTPDWLRKVIAGVNKKSPSDANPS
jgi:hypothetical protein